MKIKFKGVHKVRYYGALTSNETLFSSQVFYTLKRQYEEILKKWQAKGECEIFLEIQEDGQLMFHVGYEDGTADIHSGDFYSGTFSAIINNSDAVTTIFVNKGKLFGVALSSSCDYAQKKFSNILEIVNVLEKMIRDYQFEKTNG